MIEDMGAGQSVMDYARDVAEHTKLVPVNPSGSPPARIGEEILADNMRAAMYIRAGILVNRGLVDVPDDRLLREEILATELRFDRHRKVDGENRAVANVIAKKWLKHRLGRSPDRADAFVLSLVQPVDLDDGSDLIL